MKRAKFRIDVDSPTFVTMVGVIVGVILGPLIALLANGIVWLLKASPFHPLVVFIAISILAIVILLIFSIRRMED